MIPTIWLKNVFFVVLFWKILTASTIEGTERKQQQMKRTLKLLIWWLFIIYWSFNTRFIFIHKQSALSYTLSTYYAIGNIVLLLLTLWQDPDPEIYVLEEIFQTGINWKILTSTRILTNFFYLAFPKKVVKTI